MGIKKYKPTSPGRRFIKSAYYDEITTKSPYKLLVIFFKNKKGRNNLGRITSKSRGGGHKQLYKIIDLKELLNLASKNLLNSNLDSWRKVLPLYPISPIN